jgi:hypothetical protein
MPRATRRPIYISAPYGAPTASERAWNTARAALLARLVVLEGKGAPILVHTDIEAGVYGDDGTPADRAIGLDCDLSMLRAVSLHGAGSVYELLTDEGERTSGMRAERVFWVQVAGAVRTTSRTWADWGPRFEAVGLGERWEALREHPDAWMHEGEELPEVLGTVELPATSSVSAQMNGHEVEDGETEAWARCKVDAGTEVTPYRVQETPAAPRPRWSWARILAQFVSRWWRTT